MMLKIDEEATWSQVVTDPSVRSRSRSRRELVLFPALMVRKKLSHGITSRTARRAYLMIDGPEIWNLG